MELIGTGNALLERLVGDWSLISSRLKKICIYAQVDSVCIDIELELMYKKGGSQVFLKFLDVDEYSFFYSSQRIFYNVEICKFLNTGHHFYISFDPVDDEEVPSGEDQDYIKAKSVEGYFL